jgi:hypothetical protein
MVNVAADAPGAEITGNVPVPALLSLSGNSNAIVAWVIIERKHPRRRKKKRREVVVLSLSLGIVNCHSPFPSWEQQTSNRDYMIINSFRLQGETV